MPEKPKPVKVGINVPWYDYGKDFGAADKPPWEDSIDKDMKEMRDAGVGAIRWFILCDGYNYGVEPVQDGPLWHVDHAAMLSAKFTDDVLALLKKVQQSKLQIIPSLIDFEFCFPGKLPETEQPSEQPPVKRGRYELITDSLKRKEFLDNVLDVLLAKSTPYKSTILAWELINEPEGCTYVETPDYEGQLTVPHSAMADFIRDGCDRIKRAGFKSSVGFRRPESALNSAEGWNPQAMGVTLNQFHFYGAWSNKKYEHQDLPQRSLYGNLPCIIGEMGTSPGDPDWPGDPSWWLVMQHKFDCREQDGRWPDVGEAQDVHTRLQAAQRRGYVGSDDWVFLWSVHGQDCHTDPEHSIWYREIKDYLALASARR